MLPKYWSNFLDGSCAAMAFIDAVTYITTGDMVALLLAVALAVCAAIGIATRNV